MAAKPLSAQLRDLRDLFRRYVGTHQRPSVDACRELSLQLTLLAEKSERLEQRASDADDLEAVARDLDLAASAAASPSLQGALKAQQSELQRLLDSEPLPVSRSSLVKLAAPIGASNVFSFPRAPRPIGFDDGGHAA